MNKITGSVLLLFALGLILPINLWSQTISVSLPDTFITDTGEIIFPIKIGDVTNRGLNSFEFTITYDSTVIAIDSVLTGGQIADGYLIIPNNPKSDRIVVAAAGTTPLVGNGILLMLRARFLKNGSTDLEFDEIKFEPGQPPLNLQSGRLSNIGPASNEKEDALPRRLKLSHNFPNPFRGKTQFTMDLTEPAQVGVELYSITGRLLRTYPERSYQAGPNQLVTIESGRLPAGSYFYRVSASGQGGVYQSTGTLTIIR